MSKPAKKKDDKAGLKPVKILIPGRGVQTLSARDAVTISKRALAAGNHQASMVISSDLLKQIPGFQEAWLCLFDAIHRLGDMALLATEAERCLAIKPRFVPALVSLSVAKRMQQQHADALALINKALSLDSSNAEILNHKGVVLKEMGRHQESLGCFNRCLTLQPNMPSVIWNRADLAGVLEEAEYQRCLALANSAKLSNSQRASIHYALARSDEAAKNYAEQFQRVSEGAALKRQDVHYNHSDEIEQIHAVAKFFPHFAARSDAQNDIKFKSTNSDTDSENSKEITPIFICGLPRSGTTLTEQILSSHPQITAGDELLDLPLACSQQLHKKKLNIPFPKWASEFSESDWQAVGKEYLSSTKPLQITPYFTDKNLQNYKAIGVIQQALPQAKIIICRRNPMDNLWGCFKQYFADGLFFTYHQE
ncbi:MAG: sulfotransferase, partial [Oleibacter sp.]|nr:sulfotransferase [Thalassolituus sp.]